MHGGMVLLTTTNALLSATGSQVLLETDQHSVIGCPFTPGTTYSPCVLVQWSAAATRLKVNGAGVLLQTSIGNCLNAAGAPQGIAVVSAPAPELEAI
jgi:hypothetical protein